jgi:hypothetical protein
MFFIAEYCHFILSKIDKGGAYKHPQFLTTKIMQLN